MSLVVLTKLALAVVFAASVQTAVGFGFGLVLVPILLAFGRTLPDAVALTLGASLVQNALGLWTVKDEVRWRRAAPLALVQWSSIPLGILAMTALHEAGPSRVKQGVGAVLLLVLTMRLVVRPTPRDEPSRGWSLAAGLASGVLQGSVGMGGPPLVLLALSQRLSADRFRAFLWEQFCLGTPVQLLALSLRFGAPTLEAFGVGVALAPMLYVGMRAGRATSARWDGAALSRVAVGLLYVLALVSLLAPFVPATRV